MKDKERKEKEKIQKMTDRIEQDTKYAKGILGLI